MSEKIFEFLMNTNGMSYKHMIFALLASCVGAVYIFVVYRVAARTTFYSKNYNITMGVMAIITTAIIVAMQSSFVISLGMVGALSIVRFRTAIKDPIDLLFLFWSIGVGIICGSELYGLAALLCLAVTVAILLFNHFPVRKAPFLLVLNSEDTGIEDRVMEIVRANTKSFRVRSKNFSGRGIDMIIELRTLKNHEMMTQLREISALDNISLLSHDGEVRY